MRKLTPLLILACILRLALALRSDANIGTRLFNDDSFYLHTVSNNIGEGNGFTIDGANLTNGIQPLIVVLNAPFYYFAAPDRWLALRLSFILSALIDCFSLIVLYKLLRRLYHSTDDSRSSPPMIGAILWAFCYPLIAQTMNGMETGIASLLLLLSLYSYTSYLNKTSLRNAFLVGVSLGLLVLARIDNALLVVIVISHQLIASRKITAATLTIAVCSFFISLPWWIYNYHYFGSILPTSGTSEMLGGPSLQENLLRLRTTIADLGFFIIALPYYKTSSIVQFLWSIAGLSIIVLLVRSVIKWPFSRVFVTIISIILIFGSLLAFFYTAFFHAPYFLPRYLQPLRILMVILYAGIISNWIAKYHSKWIRCAAIGVFSAASIYFYVANFTATGVNELYRVGLWAKEHPADLIGMQQSGIAGFMADNVVNLDGKVNSDVLAYMKKNMRGTYIAQSKISVLADWKEFAEVLRSEATLHGAVFTPVDSIGLVTIYKRDTPMNQP